MRFLIKVSLPVEASNAAIKNGTLPKTIQSILAEQKPEAVYFIEADGKRTAVIIQDIQHPSEIPAVAEPWFLAFNASVEFHPAMNADDLMKAGPAIEQAVRKYA